MNRQYLNFLLNEQIQINLISFIEALILSGFLSFLIQIVYLRFSTSLSNKFDFSKNFIILGLTTTLVITIVKSSLALSLGLVGALSIVRFRAAIKEPEELVYLFLIFFYLKRLIYFYKELNIFLILFYICFLLFLILCYLFLKLNF